MNPDLAAAFDRIDSLLDVDPAHKDRMDRWEHGDFNDTDNTPALAGSDRTILIEQLRYAREALYELRHSPHLWRTHARLRHPGERVDPDLRAALRELVIDATHDGRGRLDSDEPDMYQPDIDANLARLDAILAATEAPRFETFDAADGHKGIRLAATPDHTEGGEERDIDVERLARAIHRRHNPSGSEFCRDDSACRRDAMSIVEADRAARATPRPR